MNNIELRLENIKLHNRLQTIKKSENEREQSIRKNKNIIKLYVEEKVKQLKDENEKIKSEKEELEKKYYAIPKWIRAIFISREEK